MVKKEPVENAGIMVSDTGSLFMLHEAMGAPDLRNLSKGKLRRLSLCR